VRKVGAEAVRITAPGSKSLHKNACKKYLTELAGEVILSTDAMVKKYCPRYPKNH
jgi:hypothetical protein